MAGVLDPLISPVQLNMKVLFQQSCKENVGWNDELEGPLKGAVLRDNARGNNFPVVRAVWVKHRTFNGRIYKGNVISKYPLASNTE